LPDNYKVALVAALDREVRPLVRIWRRVERVHDGRKFQFYESGHSVLVCGGIGGDAARRATEAVIALYHPRMVWSVGFAGALERAMTVGEIVSASRIIDSRDGSCTETGTGRDVLVSAASIAGLEEKKRLAQAYQAQAVDMEASAVARGAQARGIAFAATKAISDEAGFALPAMDAFVDGTGRFRTCKFVVHCALRPWLWARMLRLARNSAKAACALCAELERSIRTFDELKDLGQQLDSASKVAN